MVLLLLEVNKRRDFFFFDAALRFHLVCNVALGDLETFSEPPDFLEALLEALEEELDTTT